MSTQTVFVTRQQKLDHISIIFVRNSYLIREKYKKTTHLFNFSPKNRLPSGCVRKCHVSAVKQSFQLVEVLDNQESTVHKYI